MRDKTTAGQHAPTSPDRWYVRMLSTLVATRAHWHVSHFRSQKTAELFAYLALRCDRTHTREQLCALLWPESPPSSARANLRQSLASLRRQFEPPGIEPGAVIVADRKSIGLNPETLTTDVRLFEAACALATQPLDVEPLHLVLQQVAQLYTDELLPGFLDDWVLAERERLSALFIRAAQHGVSRYLEAGYHYAAVALSGRVLKFAPFNERSCRDLMAGYLQLGEPLTAMQTYMSFAKAFEEEIGALPSAQTQAMVAQVEARLSDAPAPNAFRQEQRKRPEATVPWSMPEAASAVASRFKAPRNRLIGRDGALEQVCSWLTSAQPRLVTVVGTGGVGKTELAQHCGQSLTTQRATVWFVALDAYRGLQQIEDGIVGALGARREPAPMLYTDQIARILTDVALPVFVLDNAEHLLGEVQSVVAGLLGAVANLRCLVTSRQPLGLDGEQVLRLVPLEVPVIGANLEEALSSPALALMVERLRNHLPDFQLTEDHCADLSSIAIELEGLPFALVLAAARMRSTPPKRFVTELRDRFAAVVAPARAVGHRHRSLYAMLEWSYNLLPDREQTLFAQLAVFRGSFEADALNHVSRESSAVLLLEQLCDCSLVNSAWGSDGTRFWLLDSARAFARTKLADELFSRCAERHAQYYATQIERHAAKHFTAESMRWIEREEGNLYAAMDYAQQVPSQAEIGLRIALQFAKYWSMRGQCDQALRRLDRFLRSAHIDPSLRVRALDQAARMAINTFDLDGARAYLGQGFELAGELPAESALAGLHLATSLLEALAGDRAKAKDHACLSVDLAALGSDRSLQALSLWSKALFAMSDRSERLDMLEQSAALLREAKLLPALCEVLWACGQDLTMLGRSEKARQSYAESVELAAGFGHALLELRARTSLLSLAYTTKQLSATEFLSNLLALRPLAARCGNTRAVEHLYRQLAAAAQATGDYDEAEALYEEALELCAVSGNRWGRFICRSQLASLAYEQERYDEAYERSQQALAVVCDGGTVGSRRGLAMVFARLAEIEAARTHLASAATYLAKARELGARADATLSEARTEELRVLEARLTTELEHQTYQRAHNLGTATPWRELVAPLLPPPSHSPHHNRAQT